MILIRIEVEVRPTEDVGKVKKALLNLFTIKRDDIKIVDLDNEYKLLVIEKRNLSPLFKFHDLLRQERILDSARNVLLNSRSGNIITFKLHKQSAYVGRISFVSYDDESPLGPITITITSDKINEIIDWLAPKTKAGKPLWEKEVPKV